MCNILYNMNDRSSQKSIIQSNAQTYPTNMLIVLIKFVKKLTIKGPGERCIQRQVTSDLARQHNAFTYYDLHIHRALCDSCGIC